MAWAQSFNNIDSPMQPCASNPHGSHHPTICGLNIATDTTPNSQHGPAAIPFGGLPENGMEPDRDLEPVAPNPCAACRQFFECGPSGDSGTWILWLCACKYSNQPLTANPPHENADDGGASLDQQAMQPHVVSLCCSGRLQVLFCPLVPMPANEGGPVARFHWFSGQGLPQGAPALDREVLASDAMHDSPRTVSSENVVLAKPSRGSFAWYAF